MRAFVIAAGTIFGLVTVAHVWRMLEERNLATSPWYLAITLASAILAVWAWRVAVKIPRS